MNKLARYKRLIFFAFLAVVFAHCNCSKKSSGGSGGGGVDEKGPLVSWWVTKADQTSLIQKQPDVQFLKPVNHNNAITIDSTQQFQTVDGFGYTLTGGSAVLLNKMPTAQRASLLQELFGNGDQSIRVSYLRVSIGASDLDAEVFSYNDLPSGEKDPDLSEFTMRKDEENLIPVLKEILAINPAIKILGSPWSPPTWMKSNNNSIGGSLLPDYYSVYAAYFVKYIQSMKAKGITVDAITPQNEPLHPGNNPSLLMLAEQQRDFIKNHLGPAFRNAGITTKIIVYDHNLDRPDYPIAILDDPAAKAFVDGSAFHLYAGDVSAMNTVHQKHPDKNLYFTEQWTGAKGTFDGDLQWHVKNVIIGTMRNWSKIALEWNLASDPLFDPHTPGGCTECKGAITIDGANASKNVSYYIIGHASKFVPPGSVRIHSSAGGGINNVVFVRPDGKKVMIALNESRTAVLFNIVQYGLHAQVNMPAASVATLVW